MKYNPHVFQCLDPCAHALDLLIVLALEFTEHGVAVLAPEKVTRVSPSRIVNQVRALQ